MNILIIGTTDILGGAAKVSWDIKNELELKGHHVSMFVADKRSTDKNVHIIPRQKWRKYLGFLLATEDLLKSDWILQTEEFKKADLIHCHNLHGRFFNLSTLKKMSLIKPVVWTLHDEWAITPHCACTFEGNKIRNGLFVCPSLKTPPRILWGNTWYLSWRKNSLYEKLKVTIVTPSIWLKKRVEKTILKKQQIKLIPNGIDTEIFKKTDKIKARQKLNLPLNKKIILFLADDPKRNIWKGWQYTQKIIEIYKNNTNVLFVCVGHDNNPQEEMNVLYVRRLEKKEEIALYYSASDALLFTSIAENFPLVILEAMSCGLPIISFDVGGVKEALTNYENGCICKYKDIESLNEGLSFILNSSNRDLDIISRKSIEKVNNLYKKEVMVENYIKLYEELIK